MKKNEKFKSILKIIPIFLCCLFLSAVSANCTNNNLNNGNSSGLNHNTVNKEQTSITPEINDNKSLPSFNKSVVRLSAKNNKEFSSGEIVNVYIDIKNSSSVDATNVSVELMLPNQLILNKGKLSWKIDKLKAGNTSSFNISLKIADNIYKNINAVLNMNIKSDEIVSPELISSEIRIAGLKPFTGNYIPIIALHGIEPNPKGLYEISTKNFDFLCSTLNSMGYKTITLMELYNYLKEGAILPEKPVIITSDDGYSNSYNYAFPIIKKYGFKMTIFLITGLIGNSDSDRKTNEFDKGNKDVPSRQMLIWPEIIEMNKYGCEFMSHTITHRPLGSLSKSEVIFELAQSKKEIEAHLGKLVLFVAYPYGQVPGSVKSILSQTGYKGGLLFTNKIENVKNIDLYRIKRFTILSSYNPGKYAKMLGLK